MSNIGCNETSVLKGRVVSLDQIRADNALADSCRKINYGISYKYDPSTLPDKFDVDRFCKAECNNEKEVQILQNAAKCLKALNHVPTDTSILDEYSNDTLLTFDYATGEILFDDKAFKKDSDEHKSKLQALVNEHNEIVASTTITNAIENTDKIQQIKNKIAELQAATPKKEDAKYNHPEIVKGTTSVKQVLDRYKELHELRDKCSQEWEQYILDYKHRHARKLDISEDTFRVFKELYKSNVFTSDAIKSYQHTLVDALRYESVKDFNENNWKEVVYDACDESRKFLNQKQLKLWQKYGNYTWHRYVPEVADWMMYDHFNDKDLMWLNALKAFSERVTALKRIEAQSK